MGMFYMYPGLWWKWKGSRWCLWVDFTDQNSEPEGAEEAASEISRSSSRRWCRATWCPVDGKCTSTHTMYMYINNIYAIRTFSCCTRSFVQSHHQLKISMLRYHRCLFLCMYITTVHILLPVCRGSSGWMISWHWGDLRAFKKSLSLPTSTALCTMPPSRYGSMEICWSFLGKVRIMYQA